MSIPRAELDNSSTEASIPWPDSVVPEATRKLLQRFFILLDADSEEKAGEYSELFAEDAAYLVSGIAAIQGRKGKSILVSRQIQYDILIPSLALKEQRAWAWKAWPGLRHEIKHLYLGDERGFDVVAVGTFSISNSEGKTVGGGSAAKFSLVEDGGRLLIQDLEIFSDPSPLTQLIGPSKL